MKKLCKKFSVLLMVLVAGIALVGCTTDKPNPKPPVDEDVNPDYLSLADYKAYMVYDLENVVKSISNQLDASVLKLVNAKKEAGVTAMNAAKSVKEVQAAFKAAKSEIASQIPLANGVYSFISLSNEEKTEILGLLEAYGVRNGLTGISLYEDAAYQMFNPRVSLGTENYIIGYGFGTLAEGAITADLDTEKNEAWKRYYHAIQASDPGTVYYHNDQGSQVGDLYTYMSAGYFTTFMNETKDGYDWVPELAKEKPQAVNPQADGSATTWRFPVKTGKDGLKYNTNSTLASRQAFDGREVALEDYLTPFKLLLDQKNGLYRGGELANQTTVAIKGAQAYYNASAKGEADFSSVGVKVYEENGLEYFEVEFVNPMTQFYAMYYITSGLYMPVPQSFLDLVGVKNFLGFNENKTETPVDNSLSLGAYTLERWDSGQQIVYKKNPFYVYADTKYAIEGIHMNILTAAASDKEAGIKEFLAGNTDAAGIPQTRLDEYKNDPRTRVVRGESNFKLNVNAADEATWEYLFGENGTIVQNPKDNYWKVEPALSNAHFVKALSLSINRKEYSDARGSIASVDFLAPNYMSDPINGITYNDTQAHKNAVADLLADTDGYGYNLELAREYFKIALAELEASGKYKPGTKANPTVIALEIAWMYPWQETSDHNELKQYFEDAFNDDSVSGGKYKLEVSFWTGADWAEVYNDKLLVGQYDIGFGAISGDPLNPLAFLNILSSDASISHNFTLNWGPNTNDPDVDLLVYNGYRWSYDALYLAANGQTVVENGANVPAYQTELVDQKVNADSSVTSVVEIQLTLPESSEVELQNVIMCWYQEGNDGYKEAAVLDATVVSKENGKVVLAITTSADLTVAFYGEMGFDVVFALTINGVTTTEMASVYGMFPMVSE